MNLAHTSFHLNKSILLFITFILIITILSPSQSRKENDNICGKPYTTDRINYLLKNFIESLSKGPQSSRKSIDGYLTIGPCLFQRLTASDAVLNNKFSTYLWPSYDDKKTITYYSLSPNHLFEALSSNAFQLLGKTFINGTYRAANEKERIIYCHLPREKMKTEPISVVEVNGQSLLVVFVNERPTFVELTSCWLNDEP